MAYARPVRVSAGYTIIERWGVVGKGNKGGDGLSAVGHLINYGYGVVVYMVSNDISDDSRHHPGLLKRMRADVRTFEPGQLGSRDVLVDALTGYRLDGAPRDAYRAAVEAINQSRARVISYDIPTGVPASGEVPGAAVGADATLMLATPRTAIETGSSSYFGQIF